MAFLDNELDPNTGTIHARALFKNPERRFTPGMFARVKLIGSGQYDALLINDSSVGTDQSVKFVLKVGADNKIEYTPVKLGPLIDGLRVVREGLKADDVIVVKGLQMVRPGMPVTPQLVAMGEPSHGGNTLVAQQ
jgi:multidrug efflux system membrane fusion protein